MWLLAVACAPGVPDSDPPADSGWTAGDAFVLSSGFPSGEDEDPALVRTADGDLVGVFFSDRAGTRSDGNPDKQLFVTRASPDEAFSAPAQATFDADAWAFAPTLAEDGAGRLHLAWWSVELLPDGCVAGVDCTGTMNTIRAVAGQGAGFDPTSAPVTTALGDWLPTLAYDRARDRLLLVFAAVARADDGSVDLAVGRTRLFAVTGAIGSGGVTWTDPVRLADLDDPAAHTTYPSLGVLPDGTFALAFTRYAATASGDVLQVITEQTTDTWTSTSADGLTWTTPRRVSGNTSAIEVFPSVYVDGAGDAWVTWLTTSEDPNGAAVEVPLGGGWADRVARPELAGYTARVTATGDGTLLFGAYVGGDAPRREVYGRFFTR